MDLAATCASACANIAFRAVSICLKMGTEWVYIAVVMGRHAGFLTAASALARVYPDDGPHLIYLPERPFITDKFIAECDAVLAEKEKDLLQV